jgi:hypothetical protein
MTKPDLVSQCIELLRNNEKFIKADILGIKDSFKGLIDFRLGIDLSESGMSVEDYKTTTGDLPFESDLKAHVIIDTRNLPKELDTYFEDLVNQICDEAAL